MASSLVWSCNNLVRVINGLTSLLRGHPLIRAYDENALHDVEIASLTR